MIPTARATFTATNTNAGGHFVASTDWYTTAVVASGPWDYWRLGEASGNAVASIVSPTHNGTYSGAVTYGVSGATADGNKAVTFPGTRYLTVANSTSALTFGDVFTSEAWVKLSSTTNYRAVMGKGSNNFAMEIEPNNTFHMAKNGAMPFLAVSTATISTGVWHHIAATKNGAAIHLYLDGVDVTSTPTTNLSMANNTKPLQIGADGDNGTVFTGSIDEPAFYTTELSAAQIALHYQRG